MGGGHLERLRKETIDSDYIITPGYDSSLQHLNCLHDEADTRRRILLYTCILEMKKYAKKNSLPCSAAA